MNWRRHSKVSSPATALLRTCLRPTEVGLARATGYGRRPENLPPESARSDSSGPPPRAQHPAALFTDPAAARLPWPSWDRKSLRSGATMGWGEFEGDHRAMRLLAVLLATLLCATSAVAQEKENSGALLWERFRNPPDDARPMMRWWWFGPAVIQDELDR